MSVLGRDERVWFIHGPTGWTKFDHEPGYAVRACKTVVILGPLVPEAQPAGAVAEAVAIMRDARGHYGIEETGGPGQPATEWDEIADRMQAFVHRYEEH